MFVKRILLALCFVMIWEFPALAQINPTPTPTPPQHFFDCEQPCWLGVRFGHTTAAELEDMLLTGDDFPLTHGLNYLTQISDITTGGIMFRYGIWNRVDWTPTEFNVIAWIRDGIVVGLHMEMNEVIPLRDIVDILGNPTEVRFQETLYGPVVVDLIYLDYLLDVQVRQPGGASCRLEDIGDDLIVSELTYYDPATAFDLVGGFVDGVLVKDSQPRIFSYDLQEYHVPPETWDSWLHGEVEGSCLSARDTLPTDAYIPATPTPAVAATPDGTLSPDVLTPIPAATATPQ